MKHGIGQPNAEGAEVAQNTRNNSHEEFAWYSFRAPCETFAPSAFGCPHLRLGHG